jgi:hypothetical protein
MTLESELETIRTNIVTNLTSKGVTASNTESLNDLVGKVNTVKTPITSSLVLKETYQNDISGVVDCLRDKFRINLSKQGVTTSDNDGLTTLSNSISLIKFDTVLTLTSDKTSASTGETVTLTATLVDINGNAVNGATINFMEGNTTLYSGITDSTGKLTYTYSSTTSGTKNLKATFTGTVNYNQSESSIINIIICLYAPILDGSESIKTISGYSSPIIQNNKFCGGCGYLAQGWSNSTNWKLTFTYKLDNNHSAIVPLIVKGTNQRDYNYIQIVTYDDLRVNTNGTYNVYSGCNIPNYNTEYTATFTKTGFNTITFDLGTGGTGSFTWSALSASDLSIGLDYWDSNSTSTYVKNIKVVQV